MIDANLPGCFAVLGHPIGHSKSPVMHNAAFERLGEPHRYFAFDVAPAELREAIAGARALGLRGLNLTVPHKQSVVDFVDHLAPEARRIGAVNTLVPRPDGWWGHSTDGAGFLAALAELPVAFPARAVVLGGGGASRSVVDALLHADPPCEVTWVSREPQRLPAWPGVVRIDYGELAAVMAAATLLVNGTTVGMKHGAADFPVALPLRSLPAGAAVVDIVYPRPPGGLLDRAADLGLATQDGLPMLLWQGVRAQELWRGGPMPPLALAAMRRALGMD